MTTSSPLSSVPTPSPNNSLKHAFGSLWKQPAFVVTFAILLTAAVGLNGATSYLQLHFRKQPVALRKDLKDLPREFGPWRQVSIDMPLSPDIQHVLGTDKYIFRDFIDTSKVPAPLLAEFEGKDYEERRRMVGKIQASYPDAVLYLSLTYYTGMVDTVAHIPDRCFIADGFQTTEYKEPSWQIAGYPVDSDGWRLDDKGRRINDPTNTAAHTDSGLKVRFINFEDQDSRVRKSSRNVTYFFQVNGLYDGNPLGVRQRLQNLRQTHGYYAKVEMMTLLPDTNRSEQVKRNFLQYAMPEIEQCLPDWANVVATGNGGTPPTPKSGSSASTKPIAAITSVGGGGGGGTR